MTAATMSRLPLSAGGAVAGSLARGGLWTLTHLVDLGYWAVGQFMRAPVAISTVAVIAGLSVLAGSNALYFQTHRHPAPLFFTPARHVVPAPLVRPVIPATRPRPQPAVDNETTGSLGNAPATDAIDNAAVMALQKKLADLKLFGDKADGVFGRHTAAAIKAFETGAGMKPRGQLTRQLLAAVMAAPVGGSSQALPAPTTVVAAVPAPRASGRPVPLAPLQPVAMPQVATAMLAPSPAAEPQPQLAMPTAVATAPANPVAGDTASGSAVAMNNLPAAGPAPTEPMVEPAAATQPAAPAQLASAQPAASVADSQQQLTPAQKLAAEMGTLPPEATAANAIAPAAANPADPGNGDGSTDPALITKIQRALASLGFLGQKIDGVPGEGTAKAIRNFEVFYDYRVTGEATPQLLNLLIQHGAQT